jgi:predicted GNAT superfamily acetyltransferase
MTDVRTEAPAARGADAPRGPVTVRLIDSEPEARTVVGVLAQIWPRDDGREPLPPELAWVFAHSGNYVALAEDGGRAVGAAIGFRGSEHGEMLLHSHIAGVLPAYQGTSVGYELKQHQRRWALDRGIDLVTWTFDPLVARNAYFNVVKLGARLTHYYVDFYGPMDDGINAGDETDRCLASWRLSDPAALEAAAGRFAPADTDRWRAAGAVDVLRAGERGQPVFVAAQSPLRLVEVPRDVVTLRHATPDLARAWRRALRDSLTAAFADGLAVIGVGRDSTYVLGPRGQVV